MLRFHQPQHVGVEWTHFLHGFGVSGGIDQAARFEESQPGGNDLEQGRCGVVLPVHEADQSRQVDVERDPLRAKQMAKVQNL